MSGFTALDYQLLLNDLKASAGIGDEATLRASMSNNFNVILSALRVAVATTEAGAAHKEHATIFHVSSEPPTPHT